MKPESEVQQEVQVEAAKHGCILMRNNSGALKDKDGRTVRYGLGNISKGHNDRIKSSDLIGFTRVTVTPDMVGKVVAVFTAVECKPEDWNGDVSKGREKAQMTFISFVTNSGGIGGFAKSTQMLRAVLGR